MPSKPELFDGGSEELAALDRQPLDQLHLAWRNHFGGAVPRHLPRWLLGRVLAYRLQAQRYGDLSLQAIRLLSGRADELGSRPFTERAPAQRDGEAVRSGSILVREWQGRVERVMVLEDGFAWNGATYKSLSRIAKAITGTSWNGHRFFGLAKPPASQGKRGGGRR